jgi:hypothetical protein
VRFSGISSGDRKEERSSAGRVRPAEPGTFRYALGLAIPRPVARLQSRSPLHQAQEYNSWVQAGQRTHKENWRNDGFVALKTGPGDRGRSGCAKCHRLSRRVVPVPGFDGSPVGEYRLRCIGPLRIDTDRSSLPASPGSEPATYPMKPPVRSATTSVPSGRDTEQ